MAGPARLADLSYDDALMKLGPAGQKWDAAEGLLYVCRRLWGQPYVAPVYALLLHQWLLLNREAGGAAERQKHVNVMVSGASTCCILSLLENIADQVFTWLGPKHFGSTLTSCMENGEQEQGLLGRPVPGNCWLAI